ncbi:MAG: hypothetical protein GY774_26455 [Planctomycetes bacterium]|nr:hypothetical protein [Planctomycetota bacterium]
MTLVPGLLHALEDSGRCNSDLIYGVVLLAVDCSKQCPANHLRNSINYLSEGGWHLTADQCQGKVSHRHAAMASNLSIARAVNQLI